MSLFSRATLSILLFGEYFTFFSCYEIGTGILSNVQYSRRLNAPVIRRLVEISLRDCAVECGLRSSCYGVNYQRMLKMCELLGRPLPIFEAERNKGWVHVGIHDTLKRDIMKKYCDNRDDCLAGQKCFREGDSFQCGIKECTEPAGKTDEYTPNEAKVLHVGATVRMTNTARLHSYYIHCCADGNWAEDCHGDASTPALTAASTSASTSTSLSTSTLISTSTPASTSASTSTPLSTSTLISTSTQAAASTITPESITIDEDNWHTLDSSTRKRQIASVTTTALTWTDANTVCKKNGGTLVRMYDEEERLLIHDWLSMSPMEAQLWVGGKHDMDSDRWRWETPSGAVQIIDVSLWGPGKPTPELERKCTSLYRDPTTYFLGNWNCNDELKFICERDVTDVKVDDGDWFIVNSTRETREIAYIGNPTLSWEKAQEVCEQNSATLAHVYSFLELEILQTKSIQFGEQLWVGAKYDRNVENWYWWSNGSSPETYVNFTFWAPGEPSNIDSEVEQCLELSQGIQFNLGDNTCEEENSFLCQRKITVAIPDDAWFSLGPDDLTLRELAYVDSLPLNWRQSREVCEMNGGTLVHIYSGTDIKLIVNGFRDNAITAKEHLWTGGRFDSEMSEWYWWSKDVKTVVDLSTLTSGTFDPDTGNCIIWSSTDFSLSNHFCNKQLTFLCQRETGYTIKDGGWFSVNGREIAFVSQESTWEAAETVCKGNGGTLAYVTDRNEIDQVLIALERRGFLSPAKIWLGGMYLRDQYKWIWQATDMPIENSLWLSGTAGDPSSYPYDVCIQLYEDFNVGMHYIQNDLCTQEYSFLCQK